MNNSDYFSCYVIGDDNLALESANLIISYGHKLLGIISDNKQAINWGKLNSIPVFSSIDILNNDVYTADFDYLFSIINKRVLPAWLINKPKKYAINYHNSLLPKYAGLNSTSWAIFNNEAEHGITWHVMDERIDCGDIIMQQSFKIEAEDTALSLNIKCSHYALNTLKELLPKLASNTVVLIPQNLSHRIYYSQKDKLPMAGVVNWNTNADEIYRLSRASTYHHYNNSFGTLKLIIQQEIFIIHGMKVLNSKTNLAPGKIVSFQKEGIQITTATNDIMIYQLLDLNGKEVTLKFFKKTYNHLRGQELTQLSIDENKKLNEMAKIAANFEHFWLKELNKVNPINLPILNSETVLNISKKYKTWKYDISSVNFLDNYKCKTNALITGILVYIYRANNYKDYTVGFSDDCNKKNSNGFHELFLDSVPFNIEFNPEYTFQEAFDLIEASLSNVRHKHAIFKDVFVRYSFLPDILYPKIIVSLVNDFDNFTPPNNSIIVIAINKEATKIIIYYSDYILDYGQKSLLVNMVNNIGSMLYDCKVNPLKELYKLALIDEEQRYDLVYKKSGLDDVRLITENINTVFDDIVKAVPHKSAITFNGNTLTYQQLNRKANYLANILIEFGVVNESPVAIYMDNSLEMIVAMLAILKAGGVYVPIDIKYPQVRFLQILMDSRPLVLLTQPSHNQKITNITAKLSNLNVKLYSFVIDNLNEDDAKLMANVNANNLAYIIYTSGSMGEPKGVMIEHRSIIRLIRNTNYIKILPTDRVAQAASCTFDAATFEIWGALLNGAHLICFGYSDLVNIKYFLRKINDEKINILWLTSGYFNKCVAENPSAFKDIKYLIVGGEKLNPQAINKLLANKDQKPKYILNGYGPTENTSFTTTYKISKVEKKFSLLPIGKPIRGTYTFVLDKYLNIVPPGFFGELYTGGEGIARGYLNKPELTAQKFIDNPFVNDMLSKLYKTGDLVRWLPDGNLDYYGRIDQQIKIRGYRIEPVEIEKTILNYKNVKQCYVDCFVDSNSNKILVAYVVTNKRLNYSLFKKFLKNKLPEYMIPSQFIQLSDLPLTINGKIDKKQLPLPDISSRQSSAPFVTPLNNLEKLLVNMWGEILKIDRISVLDNFFELGGHSLQLVELLLKINEQFNVEVSVFDFLKSPTVINLANIINCVNIDSLYNIYDNFLLHDIVLSPSLKPNYSEINKVLPVNAKAVLLTGPTGFLGAHLLYDLCKSTAAKIYCIVRAANLSEGNEKIKSTLTKYRLLQKVALSQIEVILGDLEHPLLGLSAEKFHELAHTIEIIYHNGAHVNHVYNYKVLRAANVLSTVEIIKLACIGKPKSIHYISTLSAATVKNKDNNYQECFAESSSEHLKLINGYSQTKWASEILLRQANERGIPINIYRLGWVTGQEMTGICEPGSNHLLRLIKACLQIGYAPKTNMRLSLTPVNFVSDLIVKISLNSNFIAKAYHISNPNLIAWVDLMGWLKKYGYPIELIEEDAWYKKILRNINKKSALYPLLSLYQKPEKLNMFTLYDDMTNVSITNTLSITNKLNLEFPTISTALLECYIKFLIDCGFIKDVSNKKSNSIFNKITDHIFNDVIA